MKRKIVQECSNINCCPTYLDCKCGDCICCGQKVEYEEVGIHLQVEVGDVLTSKKGIIMHSALSDQHYKVKAVEVLGIDMFRAIGEKEQVTLKHGEFVKETTLKKSRFERAK